MLCGRKLLDICQSYKQRIRKEGKKRQAPWLTTTQAPTIWDPLLSTQILFDALKVVFGA